MTVARAVTSPLLPWIAGLAALLLVSLVGNAMQAVNRTVADRTATLECDKRIAAAMEARDGAEQSAHRGAQTDVDARASTDGREERARLASIVRERDRALTELRRMQHAASTAAGPADLGCRIPADRVRLLNGALSSRAAGSSVQPDVRSTVR